MKQIWNFAAIGLVSFSYWLVSAQNYRQHQYHPEYNHNDNHHHNHHNNHHHDQVQHNPHHYNEPPQHHHHHGNRHYDNYQRGLYHRRKQRSAVVNDNVYHPDYQQDYQHHDNSNYNQYQQKIQDAIINSVHNSPQIPVHPVHTIYDEYGHNNNQNNETDIVSFIGLAFGLIATLCLLSYISYVFFSFKHTFVQRILYTKLPATNNHSHDIGSPRCQKELHIEHVIHTSSGFDWVNTKVLLFLERLFVLVRTKHWMTNEQIYFHLTKRQIHTISPNSLKLDKAM
jgi:hypothetical protein